jgi:hypothetical protein
MEYSWFLAEALSDHLVVLGLSLFINRMSSKKLKAIDFGHPAQGHISAFPLTV